MTGGGESWGITISLATDIQHLRDIELFSEFNEEQLRLLVFGSHKLSFPKGAYIFYDGQSTDGGFVLFSGVVELVHHVNGIDHTIGKFKSGDLIGEMAILTRNKRIGAAVVVEDCELLKISRSTMHRVLGEYPELAAILHQKISASIAAFSRSLDRIEARIQSTDH